MCKLDDVIDELLQTKRRLHVRPRFLMGFNEPSDHRNKTKYISPVDAVDIWRKYMQPAAQATGLQLISPTALFDTAPDYSSEWIADFLKTCRDYEDDKKHPCNVDDIRALQIHQYSCAEGYWRDMFLPKSGRFWHQLQALLGKHGGKDWAAYVHSKPLWVTETNCNADDSSDPGESPLPDEQCWRTTGKRAGNTDRWGYDFGVGSIKTLENLTNVARYSWWNTYNPHWSDRLRTTTVRLVDDNGNLFPLGQALLSGGDAVNCSGVDWSDDVDEATASMQEASYLTIE